jgi:hypothetical protein
MEPGPISIKNFGVIIIAHGRCENICSKYSCDILHPPELNDSSTEPVDCIESISNFENSNYVDKIKLYSVVPYGINNVSGYGSVGEYSRKQKVIAIREMYDKVQRYFFPDSNPMLNDNKLDTNYNTYDYLIDLLLYNWLSGTLMSQSFSSISHISAQIDRDAYNYFKTEFFKNKQLMGLQIIVKEKYSFDKRVSSNELLIPGSEYSGIFGLGDYNKTDFTIFDSIAAILPDIKDFDKTLFCENFIINYVFAWNSYILLKYDDDTSKGIRDINLIKLDHMAPDYINYKLTDNYERMIPTRIVEINNESLYHIMFFILNYINKRIDLIEKFYTLINESLMQLNIYQNIDKFEELLKTICDNLPEGPNLYFLSFACRGIWGEKTGKSLKKINSRFGKRNTNRTPRHLILVRRSKKRISTKRKSTKRIPTKRKSTKHKGGNFTKRKSHKPIRHTY